MIKSFREYPGTWLSCRSSATRAGRYRIDRSDIPRVAADPTTLIRPRRLPKDNARLVRALSCRRSVSDRSLRSAPPRPAFGFSRRNETRSWRHDRSDPLTPGACRRRRLAGSEAAWQVAQAGVPVGRCRDAAVHMTGRTTPTASPNGVLQLLPLRCASTTRSGCCRRMPGSARSFCAPRRHQDPAAARWRWTARLLRRRLSRHRGHR